MKPTPFELASLAAIIANANGGDPKTILPQALELWKAAETHLAPPPPELPVTGCRLT